MQQLTIHWISIKICQTKKVLPAKLPRTTSMQDVQLMLSTRVYSNLSRLHCSSQYLKILWWESSEDRTKLTFSRLIFKGKDKTHTKFCFDFVDLWSREIQRIRCLNTIELAFLYLQPIQIWQCDNLSIIICVMWLEISVRTMVYLPDAALITISSCPVVRLGFG